ncbi:hypothetical protein M2137_000215 [Parabacteroides sp. PFB2-10]|uniref:hypothetical protein n=1 Tax=Parabacteroides sp. PFB2-10 TaxID=1742405 RepID=UPI0024744686|nr:hypothetical protein [Parabacteroides sp. PFB2-10]MDH6311465.1 hypothetical protein [Parabacteroides sp. PFB2-10]MDL2245279.1 hypothetical protein [Parabacteroides sp. OttesenSCG-928-J18]
MRFLNVLLAVSFLSVAFVSCSMEDDMLNVVPASETAVVSADDTQLYVSFNVADSDVATRTSVSSASVVVFEGNNVYFAQDNVTSFEDVKVLLKTNRAYEVYVVANTSTSFEGLATREAVMNQPLHANDLANLVKSGSSNFTFAKGQGFETIAEASKNVETVNIHLYQLTAQVQLKQFNVNVKENTYGTVVLTGVKLINKNTARTLNATGASFTNESVNSLEAASFVTYPNNDKNNLTAMELTFTVDGKEDSRTYTINHKDGKFVEAGNIYQLHVTVNVVGSSVDCSVKCNVLDWQYNEFETSLVEL